MQVWLHPVESVGRINPGTCPIGAVLARIQEVCAEVGYYNKTLDGVLFDACLLFSGFEPNGDPDQRAVEVIRMEKVRLSFYQRLRTCLDDIASKYAPAGIDWCLPFLDYDIHFVKHENFLAELKKFPYLDCYLVADNFPLQRKTASNVHLITEQTYQAMNVTVGFGKQVAPVALGKQVAPVAQPGSYLTPPDEPEDIPEPKKKKSKPVYRSIFDE